MSKVFYATAGMGKKLQGRALVAKDGFSARYDLDRIKGVFSRPEHKLVGESYVGRVLVLDAAKGGVATAWMLYEMQARREAVLGNQGLALELAPHAGAGVEDLAHPSLPPAQAAATHCSIDSSAGW